MPAFPAPPVPRNEQQRLRTLRRYEVLDTPPKESLDLLCKLAAQMLGVPIALVSLVDEHRQWFRAGVGLEATETPREVAFCAHAIMGDQTLVVEDATRDARFAQNPLVTGAPDIRFYAGAPLAVEEGLNLGTLCVIDRKPRELNAEQRAMLARLADLVVADLKRDVLEKRLARQNEVMRATVARAREQQRRSDFAGRLNALGWWEVDAAANKVVWSREVRRIHGVGPHYRPTMEAAIGFYAEHVRAEVAAHCQRALAHGTPFRFEQPLIRADGVERWVSVIGEPVMQGNHIAGIAGAIQDVDAAKRAMLKCEALALTDAMTGLANRTRFNGALAAICACKPRPAALILIDVDRFKGINDTLGHDAGDAAIAHVARRIEAAVGGMGLVARLGGDEFAVLLDGARNMAALSPVLERLQTPINPWLHGGQVRPIGLSVGVALMPSDAGDPLGLYKAADLALYTAKHAGRGRAAMYADRACAERRAA